MSSAERRRGALAEYNRKRDFRRTAEPEGRTAPVRAGSLAFVIQKHAASHLHYDLRLELDGVMRSWAVPKGPSLDPGVKRLAMQVEDHPMEYNTFEGTIPAGEYGGGTVMLWDRGTYSPDERRAGESDADAVRRGLRAGKLSFTFHGERLHGSFALVRTDRGPKPKWLLIKHRDDAAVDGGRDITEEAITSVDSGRTMEEIAAERDRVWRSNRGARAQRSRSRSSGRTRTAPESPLVPMRPGPSRRLPEGEGWTFEPWRGGTSVLAWATPDTASLLDARGTDVTRAHRSIADELSTLAQRAGRPFVLEAEIADGDDGPVLHATDLLMDGEEVIIDRARAARREALENLLRRRRLKQVRLQPEHDDAAAVLGRAEREQWNGIVARRHDGVYSPGEQSDAVLRIALG